MIQNNEINFLGFRLHNLTMEETLESVEQIVKEGIPRQHVVLNAAKIVNGQSNSKLREIVNNCYLINADGQSIVWGARILGLPVKERVTGIDLMERLLKESEVNRWSVYLLGATEGVLNNVVDKIYKKYPSIKISGHNNGYFSVNEEKRIVENIRNSKSDILFVGISSPKKELFLNQYINDLNVPFCMGVGGSFDIIAGKSKRAPYIFQRFGFEWFYRILQEPRRMWKRYAKTNPVFIYLIIRNYIDKKLKFL